MGLKKIITLFFVMFISHKLLGQVVTQTYLDPCDLKTYVVSIPIQANNGVLIIVRSKSKVFTYSQFINGEVTTWINGIFNEPCPSTTVIEQTVSQTVSQTAASAAASATSSAAASATSSSTVSTESPTSSNGTSSDSSSESSTSNSSEEGNTEEGGGSNDGESEDSDGDSDEKKEDKKKEDKKKSPPTNPMLIASDLTSTQGPDLQYSFIASFGVSQTSLEGNRSWSLNTMIWSTLNQFTLTGGHTKMGFSGGKLNQIHSYSMTAAYLDGNYMGLFGYTNIKPNPKFGTYGYNVGLVSLFVKNSEIVNFNTRETRNVIDLSLSTSVVIFWTKPYATGSKTTLSPQIFLMNSPISWNSKTGETNVNRNLSFLIGSSIDYKISKRFNLTLNYRVSGSSEKGTQLLSNFLIGSRVIL